MIREQFGNITLINADCMDVMKSMPDKSYDLAIVDPPYGIKMDGGKIGGSVLANCRMYSSCAVRKFSFKWAGMLQGDMKHKEERIHPTQKPVALYKWLLQKFAKNGDKIIDTHLGSGSSRIAAHDFGFELTGIEIDSEYYDSAKKRLIEHQRQLSLF